MMSRIAPILLMFAFFCSTHVFGQNEIQANWMMVFDGYNTTDFADLIVDDDGNTYVAINYTNEVKIPELKVTLQRPGHVGRALVKIDAKGKAQWVREFKSNYDGRTQAMALCPNGDIILSGFCDGVNTFPSKKDIIELGFPKPKGQYHRPQFIFITRYSPKGICIWARVWNQAWGECGSLDVNSKGDIYWAVFHKGTLKEGKRIIDSLPGDLNHDERIGVYKLSGDEGNVLRKLPLKFKGKDVVAPHVKIDHQDNVLVYGGFRKRIDITLKDSLTNDGYWETHDSYLAKFNPEHELLWYRKIGGRNSQEIRDVHIDDLGKIWVCGLYTMECVISGGIDVHQNSGYEYKSGVSFFYCSFYPDGELDFAKFHKADQYHRSVMATSISIAENGLVYVGGSFTGTLRFDSIQPALSCIGDLHRSFISIWHRDSLIHIQSDVEREKCWSAINRVRISGNSLIMGGGYYGKTRWVSPNGKTFEMTDKDHGRSSYVVGTTIPSIEPPREIDTLPDRKNHLAEIQELLVCLKPGSSLPDDVWFPIEEKSEPKIDSIPILLTDNPCGVKLENVEAILYPNPTKGISKLSIKGIEGPLSINVLSESGALLLSHNTHMTENNLELDLDLRHVASGNYFVIVSQEKFRKSMRLVKF